MTMSELFDAAVAFGVDVTLRESRTPGAELALRAWAQERGYGLRDNTHTVADDHPMVDWRGMWVSTLSVSTLSARTELCWTTITVHREQPRDRMPSYERNASTAVGGEAA